MEWIEDDDADNGSDANDDKDGVVTTVRFCPCFGNLLKFVTFLTEDDGGPGTVVDGSGSFDGVSALGDARASTARVRAELGDFCITFS